LKIVPVRLAAPAALSLLLLGGGKSESEPAHEICKPPFPLAERAVSFWLAAIAHFQGLQ
jgi:hypothetical protein